MHWTLALTGLLNHLINIKHAAVIFLNVSVATVCCLPDLVLLSTGATIWVTSHPPCLSFLHLRHLVHLVYLRCPMILINALDTNRLYEPLDKDPAVHAAHLLDSPNDTTDATDTKLENLILIF